MKRVVLFLICVLTFLSFGIEAEANFESWKQGIDEVVIEVGEIYGNRIELAANEHQGVEKIDIWAKIIVESNGDGNAVSETNVRGLTMLTLNVVGMIREETGMVIDRNHPFEAMWGAGWYLSHLRSRYDYSIDEAHAAYYLGPGGLESKLENSSLEDVYHLKKINHVKNIIKNL